MCNSEEKYQYKLLLEETIRIKLSHPYTYYRHVVVSKLYIKLWNNKNVNIQF